MGLLWSYIGWTWNGKNRQGWRKESGDKTKEYVRTRKINYWLFEQHPSGQQFPQFPQAPHQFIGQLSPFGFYTT